MQGWAICETACLEPEQEADERVFHSEAGTVHILHSWPLPPTISKQYLETKAYF